MPLEETLAITETGLPMKSNKITYLWHGEVGWCSWEFAVD
jgi:hypothetical protein